MKKIISFFIIVVLMLTIGGIIYVGASDDKVGIIDHAQMVKEKLRDEKEDIVVQISNSEQEVIITSKQLDTYVMNLEFATNEKVDKSNALDQLIKQKALYLLACKNGYEVEDKVVKEKIVETKNAINSDIEQKTFLKNYLEGLGISEDEYFEQLFDSYKVRLTIGKYKNSKLKPQLIKQDKTLSERDYTQKFNKKLDNYIEELINENVNKKDIVIEYSAN